MKFLLKTILTLSLLFSAGTYANNEAGPFKISSLRIGGDGVYVVLSPAPAACNGGSYYRAHARILTTNNNYDSLYSILLAAYSSGTTLNYIFFNGLPSGAQACSNTGGHLLNLHMVELTHK